MSWLEGWGNNIYRINIDHTKVDENLTDFPLLISLSSSAGKDSDYDATHIFDELGDSDKKSIAVTTADGETQCPVEIEYWDATEEKAHLWTRVPTTYSGVDTTLYLYYDSDQPDNFFVSEPGDVKVSTSVQPGDEGTYDSSRVHGPAVIKDGSTYRMWYGGDDGSNFRIIYCESTNGTTWSNHQMVIDIGDEGTYDTSQSLNPFVIKDNSTYKMWYTGYDGSAYRIIYCESMNCTTWSGHQMVVDKDQEGTYDDRRVSGAAVIKEGASSYKMWYSGQATSDNKWRTMYANSSDGKNWSNHQMVVDVGDEGTYDVDHAYQPSVIKDGSTYKMWYSGYDGTNFRTIYADSSNGTTWSNHTLAIDLGLEGSSDTTDAYVGHVSLFNGAYRVWYVGVNASTQVILHTNSFIDGIQDWSLPSQAVWSNEYLGVWHMNQDPSGGVDSILDSTSNEYHGDPSGMDSSDLVAGKIGKALDFDGGDDYVGISDGSMVDTNYSISFSVKPDFSSFNAIYGNDTYDQSDANTYGRVGMGHSRVVWDEWDGSQYGGANHTYSWSVGSWHNVMVTIDRSTSARLYINGVEQSLSGSTYYENDTSRSEGIPLDDLKIAARPDKGYYFPGDIDEFRVSSMPRSGSWARAVHYNNNNQFLSFDPLSYLEGQCTDRYGVPMNVECNVTAIDDVNHSILGSATSVSGTGRFSLRVFGKEAGAKVLVTYGYPGDYKTFSYLAGAEYMTTISGTTLSGGGY